MDEEEIIVEEDDLDESFDDDKCMQTIPCLVFVDETEGNTQVVIEENFKSLKKRVQQKNIQLRRTINVRNVPNYIRRKPISDDMNTSMVLTTFHKECPIFIEYAAHLTSIIFPLIVQLKATTASREAMLCNFYNITIDKEEKTIWRKFVSEKLPNVAN